MEGLAGCTNVCSDLNYLIRQSYLQYRPHVHWFAKNAPKKSQELITTLVP